MSYLVSTTLVLVTTATLIGAFTLNLRRLVSAIRWGRTLVAEVGFLKKTEMLDASNIAMATSLLLAITQVRLEFAMLRQPNNPPALPQSYLAKPRSQSHDRSTSPNSCPVLVLTMCVPPQAIHRTD